MLVLSHFKYFTQCQIVAQQANRYCNMTTSYFYWFTKTEHFAVHKMSSSLMYTNACAFYNVKFI